DAHSLPICSRVVAVLGSLEQPERNVHARGLGQLEVTRSSALGIKSEQDTTERTEESHKIPLRYLCCLFHYFPSITRLPQQFVVFNQHNNRGIFSLACRLEA